MPVVSSAPTVTFPVEPAVVVELRILASIALFTTLTETVPAPAYPEPPAPVATPAEPVTVTIRPSPVAATVRAPVCLKPVRPESSARVEFSVYEKPMATPKPALPPKAPAPAIAIRWVLSSALTSTVPCTVPVVLRRAAVTE